MREWCGRGLLDDDFVGGELFGLVNERELSQESMDRLWGRRNNIIVEEHLVVVVVRKDWKRMFDLSAKSKL